MVPKSEEPSWGPWTNYPRNDQIPLQPCQQASQDPWQPFPKHAPSPLRNPLNLRPRNLIHSLPYLPSKSLWNFAPKHQLTSFLLQHLTCKPQEAQSLSLKIPGESQSLIGKKCFGRTGRTSWTVGLSPDLCPVQNKENHQAADPNCGRQGSWTRSEYVKVQQAWAQKLSKCIHSGFSRSVTIIDHSSYYVAHWLNKHKNRASKWELKRRENKRCYEVLEYVWIPQKMPLTSCSCSTCNGSERCQFLHFLLVVHWRPFKLGADSTVAISWCFKGVPPWLFFSGQISKSRHALISRPLTNAM